MSTLTQQRIDALRAFANQDVSPNERDIAKAKLEAAGIPPTPPRPPAPSAAFSPEPHFHHARYAATGTSGNSARTSTWTFEFTATGNVWTRSG